MQSALFCGRGPAALPLPKSVRSKTAILIRLFFPPSFLSGAFYTGGSSDLFITVISLLSWRRNRIPWIRKREEWPNRQTDKLELWDWNIAREPLLRHPPCLERSCEWGGESRLQKNWREDINCSSTWATQSCVTTSNLSIYFKNCLKDSPTFFKHGKKILQESDVHVHGARTALSLSWTEKRDKWLNRQKVPWWHKGGGDERKRGRRGRRMLHCYI